MYPCATCRRAHHFGSFFVGETVRYASNRQDRRCSINVGTIGKVVRHGSTPAPAKTLHVVVAFRRRGMEPLEVTMSPCEIESAETRFDGGRVVIASGS